MNRSCTNCIHSSTCFLRIEFAQAIQSFKFLAETKLEMQNTNGTYVSNDIYFAAAGACVKFQQSEDIK